MSLTVAVKDELVHVVTENAAQRRAEVASLLRFAGGLHIVSGRIVVEAELDHAATVRRLRRDLRELYNVDTEIVVVQGGSLHRGNRYVLRVLERGKDLARLAGLSVILAQGALFLVLRTALAACRAHEAKLAALPPVPEAS